MYAAQKMWALVLGLRWMGKEISWKITYYRLVPEFIISRTRNKIAFNSEYS
jgi:hypothetical protein